MQVEDRPKGLRERKKRLMREHIAETALQLFLERGFERVTVAEVSRAAEVAEQTVFNYFPTKEDLVYWRLTGFEEGLLEAVRKRGDGESVIAAFRSFILAQHGLLGENEPGARDRLVAISRMIALSPSLLARERRVFDRYTDALAELIVNEQGGEDGKIAAWVVANSLVGVHRALVGFVRGQVLAGQHGRELKGLATARAEHAFAVLERGLESYDVR